MNYYALSAKQDDICPISLAEDAILYMSKAQVASNFEYGYLPWYSYKTSKTCELPAEGVLVLKNKNIEIGIRNIADNIYVVNEVIKTIFEKYVDLSFFKINLLSGELEKINDLNYYIFRFDNFFTFEDVVNISQSTYRVNNDFVVLEKIVFSNSFNKNIIKLNNIDSAQDTFFISEIVKKEIDTIKCKGINIIEVSEARWRDSDDFNFMFLSEVEVSQLVWPI